MYCRCCCLCILCESNECSYIMALTFIFSFVGLLLFSVLYILVVHMYSAHNVISFASCLFAAQNREKKIFCTHQQHIIQSFFFVLIPKFFLLFQSSKHVSQPCTARISSPNSLESNKNFHIFDRFFFSQYSLLLNKWFGLCLVVFSSFFLSIFIATFFRVVSAIIPIIRCFKIDNNRPTRGVLFIHSNTGR